MKENLLYKLISSYKPILTQTTGLTLNVTDL